MRRGRPGLCSASAEWAKSTLLSDGPMGEATIESQPGLERPPEGTQPSRPGRSPEILMGEEGLQHPPTVHSNISHQVALE